METYSISEFHILVYALCRLHGGSEVSGGRTVARNRAVGGVPNSRHLWTRQAKARDVVLDVMNNAAKSKFIIHCDLLGIRCLDEGDHLHLQCE